MTDAPKDEEKSSSGRKLWQAVNQPVVVTVLGGLAVFFISNYIQNQYWISQQKFLVQQATLSKRLELSNAAVEDLVRAVGRLITASASVVAAHERGFDRRQLNETIDHYNVLQDEWDQSEEVLKLKLRTYFPQAEIDAQWHDLRLKLGALDAEIVTLHGFSTSDASAAHRAQFAACRKSMKEAEDSLARLSTAMVRSAGLGSK